jgi:hypothetical protein
MLILTMQGQLEQGLFDLVDANPSVFESYTVRPCGIYPKHPTLKSMLLTTFVLPTLKVEELSATMVYIAKEGYDDRIVVHDVIRKVGSELLKRNAIDS